MAGVTIVLALTLAWIDREWIRHGAIRDVRQEQGLPTS